MIHYGLDIHKTFIETVSIKSASSPVLTRSHIDTDITSIKHFASSLTPDDHVVLESTTNAFPIAQLLRQYTPHVSVANPMQTKIIAQSKVKTDKIDAEVLARLEASGFLPVVWEPDQQLLELRKITSFANALTKQQTMAKNRIHSILHRNLVPYASLYSDLFGTKGRIFLNTIELPEDERFQLNMELELLDFLKQSINTVRKRIAQKTMADKEALRLMTIPGIDYYTALSVRAAIGDITRFSSPKKLVSYLGLNPRIYQSGYSCYTGRITKRGRSQARWVLIQAAQSIVRVPGPLRGFFLRLKKRKERNKVIVAVASKLARIIWMMLTTQEDYYYSPPLLTKEKLARLRIKATGVRMKSGSKKGVPSQGGRQAYELARKTDQDKAKEAEKEYNAFIKNRLHQKEKVFKNRLHQKEKV